MTSAWLAFRTVQRYRARTALATIGVAIIGALLFDMLLLSRGLVASFADLLDRVGYDVRVLNSEGLSLSRSPIPDSGAVSAAIARLPEVASVARIRLEPATVAADDGSDVEVMVVGSTHRGARIAWTVLEGSDLPDGSASTERCPVLVGRNLVVTVHDGPLTAWARTPAPPRSMSPAWISGISFWSERTKAALLADR